MKKNKKLLLYILVIVSVVLYILAKIPLIQTKTGIKVPNTTSSALSALASILIGICVYQWAHDYAQKKSRISSWDKKKRKKFIHWSVIGSVIVLATIFVWFERDIILKPTKVLKNDSNAKKVFLEYAKNHAKPDTSKQFVAQQPVTYDALDTIRAMDDSARARFGRSKQQLIDKAIAARKQYNDSVATMNNSCKLNDSLARAWAGLEKEILAKVNKDLPKVQPLCQVKPSSVNVSTKKTGKKKTPWAKVNTGQIVSSAAKGYKKITW